MNNTATSPFCEFLAARGDVWTMTIEMARCTHIKVRNSGELVEATRTLQRGNYSVTLRIGKAEQGHAEITKLISDRWKEQSATKSCVGLAAYCNDALRMQESEGGQ